MQTIATLFVILLMIFLNGCQTRPDELIQTQKFVHFQYVEIDGKKYIDLETSFCLERDYKFSKSFLGPMTKFKNVSMEACDKLTGYNPTHYVNVTNFLDSVRREIENNEE